MIHKACTSVLLLTIVTVNGQDVSNDWVDSSKGKSATEVLKDEPLSEHRLKLMAERAISQANDALKTNPKKAREYAVRADRTIRAAPVSEWRLSKEQESRRLLDRCDFAELKAKVETSGVDKVASYTGKVEATLPKKPDLRIMAIRHQGEVPKNIFGAQLYLFKEGKLITKATVMKVYKDFLLADVAPQWYKATKTGDLAECEVWAIAKEVPTKSW